jgi:DNA mismatch endonuclease, patch repair protein
MVDIVDKPTRSRMMAGIRGKNTKPEKIIRSLLHRQGYRFVVHDRRLPGSPDLVFPQFRAVVFVHGCFWHGHTCSYFKWPATRSKFWRAKIERNQENDAKALRALREMGWRTAIIWECALRAPARDAKAISLRIGRWLSQGTRCIEERGQGRRAS